MKRYGLLLLALLILGGCQNQKTEKIFEETKLPENGYPQFSDSGKVILPEHGYPDDDTETINDREMDYLKKHPVIDINSYYAEATSELYDSEGAYPIRNIKDSSYRSWAEGVKGDGIGESFTFCFSYDDYTIAGFALKNGYGNLNYYTQNNRVKCFKIYIDGVYTETIEVKDSINFEQYAFKEPVTCSKIQFVIDSVYHGTKYQDTCIAEVALLSVIVDDRFFYENASFWIGDSVDGNYGPAYTANPYYKDNPEIKPVADIDKMLLLQYLPFNIFNGYNILETVTESKIARLNTASKLALKNNLPRLDGATALYPLYASFVHAVYPGAIFDFKKYGNYREVYNALLHWGYIPNAELMRSVFSDLFYPADNDFESLVQCNKTGRAYERLINGETDIIFCYEPSNAELQAAAEKGLDFNLTPIGEDSFVFIVNEKNVITNITQRQIRDIYTGRATSWKNISGIDEPVIPYQRPENSGSQTIFLKIMENESPKIPIFDQKYIPGHMFGMIEKITSDYYNYNSAIGYTFSFYLNSMYGNSGVKSLSIDGVAPTKENIQQKKYPYVQTIYAITAGNESENTKAFISWIRSEQGQELVEKTGYVPLH
jgi:phosphate transport system substrate-binding protein